MAQTRLKQLAQSGATAGQLARWDAVAGRWVPASIDDSENFVWTPGEDAPSLVYPHPYAAVWELDDDKDLVINDRLPERARLTTTNPRLRIPFQTTDTGAASAAVDLQVQVRYIATGELTSKAADETFTPSPVVTNTVDTMHEIELTLDRTKMAAADKLAVYLTNLGTGAFTGKIGIWAGAQLYFQD